VSRGAGGARRFGAFVLASGLALTAAWLLPTRRAPEADGAVAAVQARVAGIPPPQSGYFHLRGAGTWSSLPGGRACAAKVHRSSWEPRPLNHVPNAVIPGRAKVRAAFAARPRAVGGSYAARWDTWLLPRVSGAYTGKTDEIFQWAACKWGLPDNLLRAIAVRESTWYQYPTYRSGACVVDWGCGDIFDAASSPSSLYCNGIAKIGGYDYQADFAAGICPKTFSIAGVMSWQDPAWGPMKANQNGTFPFNRNSTAFAVDYLGSDLRGCIEGWERWLVEGAGFKLLSAKQRMWGCVGAWYAGDWHSAAADGYIARVRRAWLDHVWLTPTFATIRPPCASAGGCVSG
jgi:hypothetical protein